MKSLKSPYVVPVVACLALAAIVVPSTAGAQGGTGFGVYDGATNSRYPTLSGWISSDLLVQGGLTFSTREFSNFGILLRVASTFKTQGSARVVVGGILEIADFFDSTGVILGPFVGVDVPVGDNLSILIDGYPITLSFNGDTEASILEGRLGATWWFR